MNDQTQYKFSWQVNLANERRNYLKEELIKRGTWDNYTEKEKELMTVYKTK